MFRRAWLAAACAGLAAGMAFAQTGSAPVQAAPGGSAATVTGAASGSPAVAVPAPAAGAVGSAGSTPARPRIGLVLSGGGARGAAHVGVLKVLEELRVPVSCIAGTSMGSIVGAAYASGMTIPEMEEAIARINTEVLFKERPPREEMSIRRKVDDYTNYIGPELGVRGTELMLPKGAISGVALEGVLRELAKAKGFYEFDRLPIPFRAIATDIETGQAVVLDRGELASAMRASMSVPAAVAPAKVEGRTLVDGGLTDNLPIGVARKLCADVIIAVNVGTPLLKGKELDSILGITEQMINILTEQNVRQSLALLRPGDVLITPDLTGFTAGSFDNLADIAPRGEAAARQVANELARYGLPVSEYAALRARQTVVPAPDNRPVDEIRVAGVTRVDPQTVRDAMDTKPGQELDPKKLARDMQRVYGRGDFEHVDYRVIEEAGKRALTVDALEKSWGPDYLRFGLTLSSDFGGDSYYNLIGSYRKTWINRLGAEWRTDLQVGETPRFFTQFYQPLTEGRYLYVAPELELERNSIDLFVGQDRIASYDTKFYAARLALGSEITRWGEVKLGLVAGRGETRLDTGPPQLAPNPQKETLVGAYLDGRFDQLDNVNFPRRGTYLNARVDSFSKSMGSDRSYTKGFLEGVAAFSSGDRTLQFGAKFGGALDGDLPPFDQYSLGGFQQLSGFRTNQLYGDRMAFGRMVYQHRLAKFALLEGVFTGFSLEAGRIGKPLIDKTVSGLDTPYGGDLVYAGSLFLGADTPLGPVYLGYGYGQGNNSAFYFFLGRP
jgi:NTE family protein